jgi:hypothetical protein
MTYTHHTNENLTVNFDRASAVITNGGMLRSPDDRNAAVVLKDVSRPGKSPLRVRLGMN